MNCSCAFNRRLETLNTELSMTESLNYFFLFFIEISLVLLFHSFDTWFCFDQPAVKGRMMLLLYDLILGGFCPGWNHIRLSHTHSLGSLFPYSLPWLWGLLDCMVAIHTLRIVIFLLCSGPEVQVA